MHGNNIKLTIIPPIQNSHNHLLHTLQSNQQKILHMILPLSSQEKTQKHLSSLMQINSEMKARNIQQYIIKDQIIYITIHNLQINKLHENNNKKIIFLQKMIKYILEDSNYKSAIFLYDGNIESIIHYKMTASRNNNQQHSECEKLKIYSLICYCLLSSCSLHQYIQNVKKYLWSSSQLPTHIKNDGSVRIQQSIMLMLKSILSEQIPNFKILSHTLEILRQRLNWNNKNKQLQPQPQKTYINNSMSNQMKNKSLLKTKVKKNKTGDSFHKSKRLKQSFSMTGFSTSSARKYKRASDNNYSRLKVKNSQSQWFNKNATVQSFYQPPSSFGRFPKESFIMENESFGVKISQKLIDPSRTLQLKASLENRQNVDRNEVKEMIKVKSLAIDSRVCEMRVQNRKREIKICNMVYFISQNISIKNNSSQNYNSFSNMESKDNSQYSIGNNYNKNAHIYRAKSNHSIKNVNKKQLQQFIDSDEIQEVTFNQTKTIRSNFNRQAQQEKQKQNQLIERERLKEKIHNQKISDNCAKQSSKSQSKVSTQRNIVKQMSITTENPIVNNYNFLVNILNHFKSALSTQMSKWSLFTYVYYLHYGLIRSLQFKNINDSSSQGDKMIEMLQKMRKTNRKKKHQPFTQYANYILQFDYVEYLKNGKTEYALQYLRRQTIQLLVTHFEKISQYIHKNKSQLINKQIFKAYVKYMFMIALAIAIIKSPSTRVKEFPEYESYILQIERKDSISINVLTQKQNLQMLLQNMQR